MLGVEDENNPPLLLYPTINFSSLEKTLKSLLLSDLMVSLLICLLLNGSKSKTLSFSYPPKIAIYF